MKKFLKENKNIILVGTYFLIAGMVIFNHNAVLREVVGLILLFSPLWYAIAIAFVLNIPMSMIEKLLKKVIQENTFLYKGLRPISLIITLLLTVIVLYLLLMIIVPKVAHSLQVIVLNFSTLLNNTVNSLDSLLENFGVSYKLDELPVIKDYLTMSWDEVFENFLPILNSLADGFIANAMAFTSAFLNFFLSFFLSMYLLIGKETFIAQSKKVIKAFFNRSVANWLFDLGDEIQDTFTKYIGGQLVDSVFNGVMFYIVFNLMGYPFPELLAVIIAVCGIVPVFGPMFAMLIDFTLIFAFDVQGAIIFIVIYQVLSNLEANIVYPRIVGSSIGLPGLWVLLSIFILGGLYGIAGMLIAVPLTAVVYTLFGRYVNERVKNKETKIKCEGGNEDV